MTEIDIHCSVTDSDITIILLIEPYRVTSLCGYIQRALMTDTECLGYKHAKFVIAHAFVIANDVCVCVGVLLWQMHISQVYQNTSIYI